MRGKGKCPCGVDCGKGVVVGIGGVDEIGSAVGCCCCRGGNHCW